LKHLLKSVLGCVFLLGCQSRQDTGFFKRTLPAIRESLNLAHSVYVPAYSEQGFPAPAGIYRRMHLIPRLPRRIDSIATSDSVVALTFDACSTLRSPRADTSVIYQLLRSKTPATFFLGGRWVEAFPDLTRLMARTPFFEIANHSYAHGHLDSVSQERLLWEIRYTQDIIAATTGEPPVFFRAPYLESDSTVARVVAQEGLILIAGTATGDPDSLMTATLLTRRVDKLARPGSIFILHTNPGGWHTAEALHSIIDALNRKGLHPVTMSEMMRHH